MKSLETSLQDEQLKAKNLQTAMEEIQFCNEELTVSRDSCYKWKQLSFINYIKCSYSQIQAEEMIEKRTMIGDGLAPGAAHPGNYHPQHSWELLI